MFCTNCGAKFEGKFCPYCGTPAYVPAPESAPVPAEPVPAPAEEAPVPAEPSKYPPPPIGTYTIGSFAAITVDETSIIIDKHINDYGKTYIIHNMIPYSELAAVSFCEVNPGKKKVRCCLCLRPVKIMHIQLCKTEIEHFHDPFSIDSINQEKGHLIYDFLKAVADINAYTLPEPAVLPKGFKFQHLREYTEYRIQGENPELQAEIREKQRQGIACCPKCGCTSLASGKKGFSFGQAVIGGLVSRSAGAGLLAGTLGSDKPLVTCLNCGHKWNP